MIGLKDFYEAYQKFRPRPDGEQRDAIESTPEEALFIVAGPGTGKTTCLTLRILKLILVDDVPPRGILATTFTNKAAAELRSRILGWGFRVLETLEENRRLTGEVQQQLKRLDINQVITGTIDSICEEVLRDYREPGTLAPVLADDFVSKTLLLRSGLLESGRYRDGDLDGFLLRLRDGSAWGWNIGAKNDLIQSIWDRRFQDQIDWDAFRSEGPKSERKGRVALGDVIAAYEKALADRGMVDFSLLEQEVLRRLRQGQLAEFLQQIRVVLVDEYQDTNLLQEGIYFEVAKACHGSLTVVGDDDQSLYRFRGATVELFSGFSNRYRRVFKRKAKTIFLKTNYRSTQRIVTLVNAYANLDKGYQTVRVAAKPALVHRPGAANGVPVLGMFREDADTLAAHLAEFIYRIFRGKGYKIPNGTRIECQPEGGDIGDCALLCSSPAEYSAGNEERLPLLLRRELQGKPSPISVFNPRGQDLTGITVVMRFGGLLLECLDPGGVIEAKITGLPRYIRDAFRTWRNQALDFVAKSSSNGLKTFATGWFNRKPKGSGWHWPASVPVLELVYGLVHFFPKLYNDPEGQIYLEVFARQITACEQVGSFKGRVLTDPKAKPDGRGITLPERSVMELLRNFLGPIASGTIKVNEELLETFPRDRLSILSIHQAKGLEFPLTIVDVGSDFKSNHHAHAFKRFPRSGGLPHALEDLLRSHTDLGIPTRSALNRAFDDLYRQFFVAYSRPQEVLLLVGLRKTLPGREVSNVATGWVRSGQCAWARRVPFVEI
jgi:DNA helicase-2/ATP-dependent DNA helicase PcrA